MKSIQLYQVSTTGKIKHLIITADGAKLTTEWFTTKDGVNGKSKAQSTTETVKGKNAGRANETTDEQQCLLEFERKVTTKCEEGYVTSLKTAAKKTAADLDVTKKLPAEFAPSKAISKTPENPTDGTWLAERKFNGVCLVLQNTGTQSIVYSRRMNDITTITACITDLKKKLAKLPAETIVVGELIATDADGVENTKMLKGVTHDKTTPEKAAIRYAEMLAAGYTIEFRCYEVIFFKGEDISKKSFTERNKVVELLFGKRELFTLTEKEVAKAKKAGWEGFIIRRPDMTYGYDLRGKPKREGGYKFKFLDTVDCIVTKIAAGNGKHDVRFARFYLSQYENGKLIGCGWAGLGTLGEDAADELTKELKKKGYKVTTDEVELDAADYFAIELEYQSRQPKNAKGERCFEFPIIQRIRDDKPLKECIFEETDDE